MEYTVSKEKGNNRYYIHRIGDKTPINNSFGDKKRVYRMAAKMNGVDLKTFIKMMKGVNAIDQNR